MVITYYGVSCFKIQSGDTVLALNPPSKGVGIKAPRFQADIVFISRNHEEHSDADAGGLKGAFLIDGPGEYEIKGVTIRGIQTFNNTVYTLTLENVKLCHLGDFGEKELMAETSEALGDIDVLFAPIGGEGVTGVGNMVKIINQIEPKVIIPMNYNNKILSDFLKEIGQGKVAPVDRFTFRGKDILDKKGEVVVLL
ncbi:MBL fold metallo-hydrolase [Patescibacteria group bacterium]|nr:MBL fold metallo-hydrolase [Patescibacteria group bacterium]MBU2633240.1 MBL fold metallo-hydrolase [Patescibacteria group bacterium]